MRVDPIKSPVELKRRINRFLDSSLYGRGEVRSFLSSLEDIGDTALFGGMLRDLCLVGISGFNSDIDIVIETKDHRALESFLRKYDAKKNKFGGYRLFLSKWQIDIWALNNTWALKNGYASGDSLNDLCKTTFFDWDGIIYKLSSTQVTSIDSYIDRINSKIIDINLSENPNPTGNIIKAFRYCEKYEARLSSKLARYTYSQIRSLEPNQISLFERLSHNQSILGEKKIESLLNELASHQKKHPILPFEPKIKQLSLWKNNS